jgi:alkylation response protein AidB-like acyl-CoA dehydrogenase
MPEMKAVTETTDRSDRSNRSGISLGLSDHERAQQQRFRAFAQEHIAPHAGEWERQESTPPSLIEALRREKLLGAIDLDPVVYGLLTEEIGKACSSVRSLLTVHDMVTLALRRRGSDRIREELVPRMLEARTLGALSLSEPAVGSNAAGVQTRARTDGDHYILNGRKKWITYGRIADVLPGHGTGGWGPSPSTTSIAWPGMPGCP